MSCLTNMDGRPAARPSNEDDEEDVQAGPKVDLPDGAAAARDVPHNAEENSRNSTHPGANSEVTIA